jgi:hypothetical protein
MSEGAANLVDHVFPDVPIRQFVLTMPFSLRFPLAFDGKLLSQVLRIFTDTVGAWYHRRLLERNLPNGETGAVTVIQRANSDLRLSPHFHCLFLDGVYAPDQDGKTLIFHPAPAPSQQDIEDLIERASHRILRFLKRRGVISFVPAPGDGEISLVSDETIADKDPLLAKLLAAASAGASPAGHVNKRKTIRFVLDPHDRPIAKGTLCGQSRGFNLQAATRLAANDKAGRERLCRYILRPPFSNDRLRLLPNGNIRLDLKHPWSDGTRAIDLEPLAFIARLAALVPSPRFHLTHYFGVLSSHSHSRSLVVPKDPAALSPPCAKGGKPVGEKPARKSRYIPWSELLRRTFGFELKCSRCHSPLRLIALIKTREVVEKILNAMHLPADVPELHPARPPPGSAREAGDGEDYLN